jgi:hypothetical protein
LPSATSGEKAGMVLVFKQQLTSIGYKPHVLVIIRAQGYQKSLSDKIELLGFRCIYRHIFPILGKIRITSHPTAKQHL